MLMTVEGVTARYPDTPEILRDTSLELQAGSRTVLLGANGSGKTTLLRCLCGSHKPERGVITLHGEPVAYTRKGLRHHRHHVQLVLQDPDEQLFSADVRQDVSFGPTNMGLSAPQVFARVDEALELLSITHLADRPTHHLSYGERKRVSIAGAVAMRPEVLLLDEPTAGLDPVGVREMIEILDRLREWGTTLVLSTHDVYLALSQADQVGIVVDQHVICGDTVDLLSDADLLRRSRLEVPWPLELASRMGWEQTPRNLDEVIAAVHAHLG